LSPACPDWNQDDPRDLPRIVANAKALRAAVENDASLRPAPTLAMAETWHRAIYDHVFVPHADYVGHVRDSDPQFPCLVDYEVSVGSANGVKASDVPAALDSFIRATQQIVLALDRAVPAGTIARSRPEVQAIVRLCAYAHGEWIRIHPFANGNGRTARILANWIAVRYGLPAFVRIKPRPDDALFAGAAAASMRGDHGPTEAMFAEMLIDALEASDRLPSA